MTDKSDTTGPTVDQTLALLVSLAEEYDHAPEGKTLSPNQAIIDFLHGDDVREIFNAINEKLHSIRSAELPVEPSLLVSLRNGMSINDNPNILDTECDALLKHIDALKAYALKEKERADIEAANGKHWADAYRKWGKTDATMKAYLSANERAEKAESELAAIRSAELPVEPERLRIPFNDTEIWKSRNDWIIYAKELQSALKLAQEVRDEWERKAGQYMDERDKAEAELAALRGRMMDKVCVDSLAWSTFIDEYDRYSEGDPSVPFSELRNSLVIVIESAVALKAGK